MFRLMSGERMLEKQLRLPLTKLFDGHNHDRCINEHMSPRLGCDSCQKVTLTKGVAQMGRRGHSTAGRIRLVTDSIGNRGIHLGKGQHVTAETKGEPRR